MQGRLIYKEDPIYPENAKSAGLSISVGLNITINEKGEVTESAVITGNTIFAAAAMEAVSQWRYEPVLIDEIPTPVSFNVEIFFTPDEIVDIKYNPWEELLVNNVTLISEAPSDTTIQADPLFMFGNVKIYNGREYYSVTPEMSAPVVLINKFRLREMTYTNLPKDEYFKDLSTQPILVIIYINENGGIDGIQQSMGPKIPVLEKELMELRVQSPASF
ncbi:MAG: energy transducer TonB, partial [Synergistaceae bacterium]|nr:energy transducer TonB [Synergistaceae bacterium]